MPPSLPSQPALDRKQAVMDRLKDKEFLKLLQEKLSKEEKELQGDHEELDESSARILGALADLIADNDPLPEPDALREKYLDEVAQFVLDRNWDKEIS